MSLKVPCRLCGQRPVEEFVHAEIPVVPASVEGEDARDVDRGFMSSNPEGEVEERWFHLFGCRRWTTVRRDTRDDRVLSFE